MNFSSRRSPVFAPNGMVASSQPLATMAGVKILLQGGNAADAAVATAAALNVTEPTSTGLGGDMFALFYDAQTKNVTALNGSGRAPAALTIDLLRKQNLQSPNLSISNPYHAHNITVPGACAGWCDLIARHGTLPLRDIFVPALELAENGFPVAPITAHFWQRGAERQLKAALNGRALTIDGRGPRAGEIFRNPGLARALRAIAEGGKDVYYRGDIARAIVDVIEKSGGVMTLNDLAAHASTWDAPISTTYHGYRVWECPPNGQGLAALLALNLLEGFDLTEHAPTSAERWHLLIEAMRVAFADTRWYVADPAFAKIPVAELLSKKHAAERRARINPNRATLDTQHGAPVASSDTVYFCVVDGAGNSCSFINSNYMGFGTGIVPAGWGFTLQNRGNNFSLDPNHPNALAPRKRPYHTIIPGMITRDVRPERSEAESKDALPHSSTSLRSAQSASQHELVAPFGVMGGFMQPQGHMQVVVGLMDDLLDPQTALDRPRFCLSEASPLSRVEIEAGVPFETLARLAAMGHTVAPITGYARATFGRGQIIVRDSETGVLCGGSDPRADGCAVGI